MACRFKKINLHFKKPGGTSRGILYDKDTYILIWKEGEKTAYGECNLFKNLSWDDRENYEEKLAEVCRRLPIERESILPELSEWPSLQFGVETVLKDRENGCRQLIFPGGILDKGFSIPINGLIWMGSREDMMMQVKKKLRDGYTSIKLKIGAIDFDTEVQLMQYVRRQFSANEVEIRVDANGAFEFKEAKEKIKRLSDYEVNYIEQPIKAGQWQEMAALSEDPPVKIALDEELIGIRTSDQRKKLIETISPGILILKPALVGGFDACNEWKQLIEDQGGEWVVTSALESNIGLNAIAQYTALNIPGLAQGLGTGGLFTNNFPSPYTVDAKGLHYHCNKKWDLTSLA